MIKRILFIETGTGFGGSAKFLLDLMRWLNRNRFEPFIIYSKEGPNIKKIKDLGIHSENIFLSANNLSKSLRSYVHLFFWLILAVLPNTLKILKQIKQNKIDLVYLNNEILTHIPSIIATKMAKKKVVCHNHGLRRLTFVEKRFVSKIDSFICVSEAASEMLKEDAKGKPIKTVYNGLNIRDYNLKSIIINEDVRKLRTSGQLVGMVGRIIAWKGHLTFVQAAAEVLKKNMNIFFVVIGDDLTRDRIFLNRLKQQVLDLNIEDRFFFTGWKDDVRGAIGALDIVVHPSVEPEPFGISIIEAMALGKPVIGSRLGAIPEIIDDQKDGLLFKAGDSKMLAEKIEALVEDEELRFRLGRNARQTVMRKFDINHTIQQIEKIINEEVADTETH